MIQELDLAPGERARFISDIHFGHAKALAREPEELGFLLEGCSHLVVCGDLSETRESPCREEGLEKRARFLRMCRDAGVQPVLLAGNHDPDEKAGLLKLPGRPHLRARPCAVQGGGSVGMGIFEKQAGFPRTDRSVPGGGGRFTAAAGAGPYHECAGASCLYVFRNTSK
ncbi:MAG: hypothetical protein ACLTNK_00510 [Akkermansia muciniphila]